MVAVVNVLTHALDAELALMHVMHLVKVGVLQHVRENALEVAV